VPFSVSQAIAFYLAAFLISGHSERLLLLREKRTSRSKFLLKSQRIGEILISSGLSPEQSFEYFPEISLTLFTTTKSYDLPLKDSGVPPLATQR
jgi:hypothetical protein